MPDALRSISDAFVTVFRFLRYVIIRFDGDGGLRAAAALTYSALLSLVPLIAIAFAVFSAFPAFEDAQEELQSLIFDNFVPEVGGVVREQVMTFAGNTGRLTAAGVVALAVSAVLLLATIEASFNTIWRVERQRPWMIRLLVAWAILTLGPMLIGASFSLSSRALLAASEAGLGDVVGKESWLSSLIPFLLEWGAFALIYTIVPARRVPWLHGIAGGAVTAIAIEVLKRAFAAYLLNFPSYQVIYGALATIPIFLVWVYLCWTVVIFGAEITAALGEWRDSRKPEAIPPLSPLEELTTVLAVLRTLHEAASRTPQAGEPPGLLATEIHPEPPIPAELIDRTLDRLATTGHIALTEDSRWLAATDPHQVTVYQLFMDLGLAIGTPDHDTVPKPSEASPFGNAVKVLMGAEKDAFALTLVDVWKTPAPTGPRLTLASESPEASD